MINKALEIRDEDGVGENTALRVGSLLLDIIDALTDAIDSDTLQLILADFASLTAGKINWGQSRCVIVASMGSELDNVDGDDWAYTEHNGDIVFNPTVKALHVVGTPGDYSPAPNVLYVNAHSCHAYKWDNIAHKMVQITDSFSPSVITYRNTPPFSDVAIGESYYYESGATKKIAVKLSSESTHSFDIDPKKIYVFKDVKQTMVWDSGTWLPVGGDTDQTLENRVSALEDAVDDLDASAGYDIGVTETAIVFTSRNMPYVSVGDVDNNNVSCKAGRTVATTFRVSGRRLTSAIQIAVSDPTNWSVSPVSISPTDGKVALTLVTITYRPASGTTAGTTHNCNVVVSSGGTTFGTIAMVGTVAAAPSITLTMSSATITTTQDTPATATLNVKGSALEGDITLAISGTGFTLSDNSVSKADAESAAGADVTVTFDGSAAGSATITATSANATNATASVEGKIPTPLAEGSYFNVPANNGNGSLRYTVLANGNVSVKSNGSLNSTTDNPLVIPATVNDSDATAVYDSGGTAISASGLSYNVTEIPSQGFINSANQNPYIYAIVFSEGLKTIGQTAFKGCKFTEITLPASLTSIGRNAFISCSLLKVVEFLGSAYIDGYAFDTCASIDKVILNGNSIANQAFIRCSKFTATSGDKPIVINRKTTGYQYRANATISPFPQNENNKVWAKLYVPDVSGYVNNNAATHWGCFDEVLDINTYTE